MERPAKRQKLSSSGLRPHPTNYIRQDGELSCTHADAKTQGSGGRPIVPTPILTQNDLRRRYIFDGSDKNGQNQPLPGHAAGPIVPRAPDTTVIATAVDVNVQDGNTTIANTLVLQATDATIVSFTSLGVLTVPAETTASNTNTLGTMSSGSSKTTASPLSSGASLSTGSLSSSTLPTLSLPPGYNSSATSTSDRTTTITLTSTLNVSFLNGTVVTIPNPSETNASATLISSTSNTRSATDRTGDSTVTSKTSDLSNLTPASATGSMNNGANGAPLSGGVGAAGSGSPTTAVSPATSSSSHGGPAVGPPTPTVVGGVVGGVAGLAFLLLILLALLRWYRKRLQSRGQLPEQLAARSVTGGDPSGTNQMSSRSSHAPFAAAILSSTRRWRPQSSATTATAVTEYSTVPDSERGFQRIAGRKIAPVLGTGSDQYGGNYGAFEKDFPEGRLTRAGPSDSQAGTVNNEEKSLAGSSFYRDSQGFYGGKGDPLPTSPTLVSSSIGHKHSSTRDLGNTDSISEDPREGGSEGGSEGYAVMRPSPARTPMTSSPSNSSLRLPIQQGPVMEPGAPPTPALPTYLTGRRPDGVGRSLSSQDGSRGSRFTESV
jgi:hypothetical protein